MKTGRQVHLRFPNGKTTSIDVPTVESWSTVVEALMPSLKPGSILALSGPLGAGKTTFVQNLCASLGAKRPAQSPTFALMRSYPIKGPKGIKRIIHVDAYRIEDEREMVVLDLDEEMGDGESILVVEWPENMMQFVNKKHSSITSLKIEASYA